MKLLFSSDIDVIGSGYVNLSLPLLDGLAGMGHDIKVIALGYNGTEHNRKYSLIPCQNFAEQKAMLQNLLGVWNPDAVMVAFDLSVHELILNSNLFTKTYPKMPYIGIFPLESEPLCFTWSVIVSKMFDSFCISRHGTNECAKAGLDTKYFEVGVDTVSWRVPEQLERESLRSVMGADKDTFVILQVADNQERKFLSGAFDVVSRLLKKGYKVKYWLVTREGNQHGYRIRDLCNYYAISKVTSVIERGLPFKKLWGLYASADCFLLTSKGEGLGLPVLESMGTGLPVVASSVGGVTELLSDGRGLLVSDFDATFVDVFGNGVRRIPHIDTFVSHIETLMHDKSVRDSCVEKSLLFVKDRVWSNVTKEVGNSLRKIENEKQK